MLKKIGKALSILSIVSLFGTGVASAHVTVKPVQVGVASYQTFSMSVPVEKDQPTIGLRLVVPEGLSSVTPTVKPGWTIATKKDGAGESAKVTEISWTGGSIPAGQRDDFTFSAKTPADATTISWKAYQTYQDGSVVSWDKTPSEKEEGENVGPYSTTAVVDDLTEDTAKNATNTNGLSWIALVFSLVGIALALRKN